MRLIVLPLLVLMVIAASSATPSADVLPIALADNRVFVEARVDGQGPFRFLVDTGSSTTTIDVHLAKRLAGHPQRSGRAVGAGERSVPYRMYRLESLVIGGVRLGPMDVPALDYAPLSRVMGFTGFDGVLGAELFHDRVVTIDVRSKILVFQDESSFRPRSHAIGLRMALDENGVPVVLGSVHGLSGRFMIDTGDRSSLTLFGPFWRRHNLERQIRPDVVAMTGYGIGGPIRSIVGRCRACMIGSVGPLHPVTRLSLQKAGSFIRTDVAGSVGFGILRRYNVSFDYARKKMWLAPGAVFADADRYDRSGTWLALGDAHSFEIADVVDRGPAAQSGLRRGDRVFAVDRIAASPQTLGTVRELLRRPDIKAAVFHTVRNGRLLAFTVALRNLISPPAAAIERLTRVPRAAASRGGS